MPAEKNSRRSSRPRSQRVKPRSQRTKPRIDQEAIDDQKFQQKLDAKQFIERIEREANEAILCPTCASSNWRMKPKYQVDWVANSLIATLVCRKER